MLSGAAAHTKNERNNARYLYGFSLYFISLLRFVSFKMLKVKLKIMRLAAESRCTFLHTHAHSRCPFMYAFCLAFSLSFLRIRLLCTFLIAVSHTYFGCARVYWMAANGKERQKKKKK